MKTKLLLFAALLFRFIPAQNLTLTQIGYEPVIGDVNSVYNLDTSFYASGLPSNISGNSVTWDFSNLAVTNTLLTTNYVSPTSLTVTAPAGSTYASTQGNGSYSFYKSMTTPTTQTEILSIKSGTLALTFTNPGIIARYPLSYGFSLVSPVAGSVTFSLPATFSGSITTIADGQGTLLMPQSHTFNNILRLKSIQTISVSVIFVGVIAVVNQTSYSYFHSTSKFPILTINSTATTFSSQTTNVTTANGNSLFLVGIKTNFKDEINFGIYPNPAIHSVAILLENNQTAESVSVINTVGQKIRNFTLTNQINISELPRGMYYIEVKSNGFYGRKPLMITD